MLITTMEAHVCSCCGNKIPAGSDCYVWLNTPKDPTKDEFEVVYECKHCMEHRLCEMRLVKK